MSQHIKREIMDQLYKGGQLQLVLGVDLPMGIKKFGLCHPGQFLWVRMQFPTCLNCDYVQVIFPKLKDSGMKSLAWRELHISTQVPLDQPLEKIHFWEIPYRTTLQRKTWSSWLLLEPNDLSWSWNNWEEECMQIKSKLGEERIRAKLGEKRRKIKAKLYEERKQIKAKFSEERTQIKAKFSKESHNALNCSEPSHVACVKARQLFYDFLLKNTWIAFQYRGVKMVAGYGEDKPDRHFADPIKQGLPMIMLQIPNRRLIREFMDHFYAHGQLQLFFELPVSLPTRKFALCQPTNFASVKMQFPFTIKASNIEKIISKMKPPQKAALNWKRLEMRVHRPESAEDLYQDEALNRKCPKIFQKIGPILSLDEYKWSWNDSPKSFTRSPHNFMSCSNPKHRNCLRCRDIVYHWLINDTCFDVEYKDVGMTVCYRYRGKATPAHDDDENSIDQKGTSKAHAC